MTRLVAALAVLFGAGVAAPAAAEDAPPAVTGSPVATPDARVQALEQKVEALQAEVEAQKALAAAQSPAAEAEEDKGPSMRVYGFVDMGLNKVTVDGTQNLVVPSTAPHFALGNLNLYFDAQVDSHWSALSEVRYTTLPNGSIDLTSLTPGKPSQPTMTETQDTDAPAPWAPVRLGSIILERAYIQYFHNDRLQLRVGFFLTPFGIWNIDHGMPTLISMALPQLEVNEMIPIRQLGVEALGNEHVGPWELGYFAYVSNGRGEAIPDPTADKMLGGRIYARTHRPFWMTLGLSGLAGSYADQRRTLAGPNSVTRTTVTAYKEKVFGADASLDIGALRLRTEFIYRMKDYEAGKRDIAFGQAGTYSPDARIVDWYGLLAYQLPWGGIEPYLYGELYHFPTVIGDGLVIMSGGVNVHFTERAQLKFQYAEDRFYSDLKNFSGKLSTGKRALLRLVLAF